MQNAILLSSLHNYVANIRQGKHQFGPRDREGLNQFGGRCLAPNSSMISARVHAGLAYYLRRIGRCAAPLSPLIETIVCRSAVDPWSGVRSTSPSSLSRPRTPRSHVRVAIRRCTRSAQCIFIAALRLISDPDETRTSARSSPFSRGRRARAKKKALKKRRTEWATSCVTNINRAFVVTLLKKNRFQRELRFTLGFITGCSVYILIQKDYFDSSVAIITGALSNFSPNPPSNFGSNKFIVHFNNSEIY